MNEKKALKYALIQAVYLSTLLGVDLGIEFEITDEGVLNHETNKEATIDDLVFIIDCMVNEQEAVNEMDEHEEDTDRENANFEESEHPRDENGKFASGTASSMREEAKKSPYYEHKKDQLEIIKKYNPMLDDYHTGIRSVNDIKDFEEVLDDDESFVWGDYSREDAQRDLEKGEVTIYSSNPIKQGVFVSTSRVQAEEYAGGSKIVYSKTVPLKSVAWINGDEGQFANVEEKKKNVISLNKKDDFIELREKIRELLKKDKTYDRN